MSSSKHTPGPWQESQQGDYVFATRDGGGAPVICFLTNLNSGEAPGNLKLIAAAPDLLWAAREMVSQIELTAPVDGLGHALTDNIAYHALRDAIAKAEGEQP